VRLGINSTTRALEKDKAALVLLSMDTTPFQLCSHLPVLCAVRRVPLHVLPGDASIELGSIFGCPSIAAVSIMVRRQVASSSGGSCRFVIVSRRRYCRRCHRCDCYHCSSCAALQYIVRDETFLTIGLPSRNPKQPWKKNKEPN